MTVPRSLPARLSLATEAVRRSVGSRFDFGPRATNLRTETLAGATTFLSMASAIPVTSSVLAQAGLPVVAAAAATSFAAGFGSILMGLVANVPLALAPGIGLSAYFTYTVVQQMHVPWPVALGCVFVSGLAFLLLTLLGIRQMIVAAIPAHLFAAMAGGIGLFVGFLGLKDARIVEANAATLVSLGTLHSIDTGLSLVGLLLIATLRVHKIPGAILIGVIATTLLAAACGRIHTATVPYVFADLTGTVLRMDVAGIFGFHGYAALGALEILFVFLFVDLFDNLGTLVAITRKAGLVDDAGHIVGVRRMLLADSVATMVGACAGTCTVTTFVESAAGVESGGRTGVTAIVTGSLFLATIAFAPYARVIPVAAIAPALILVGCLMMTPLAEIAWHDPSVAIPSFLTVILIPLTFSIANGLAFGIIAHVALKVAKGGIRRHDCPILLLAGLFVARFAWMSAG